MKHGRRLPNDQSWKTQNRHKKKREIRIQAEAEPVLQNIFSRIGKPEERPFAPDPFQITALDAINRTDCLVMAPTGSGKTWIAEQAILSVFRGGKRCWYASPLKALTNAKWVEFGDRFNCINVGILTGDTKENPEAPIIVGTTEILRNQLYDAMHRGENMNCDLVILDEAHFLGDEDRGVVWEEIMIYLPSRINLLLLSATIENGREIASWLSSIRKKECVVVEEQKRPVPLYPLFLHPSGRIMPFIQKRRLFEKVERFAKEQLKKRRYGMTAISYGEIIDILRQFDLLPAIFFLQSRSECDKAVESCRTYPDRENDMFQENLQELLTRNPRLESHKQLYPLRTRRVGSHHGGQLPAWKFLVESMMKKGYLDAIFATSTVAAGVNFPARTIVMFNSDYFNGRECVPLDATGFHQMTGRAGRRGQDEIGFMLLVPGKFMDLYHIKRLLFSRPEDITSRIRNDFSMVLNLLLSQGMEDIRHIFEKSLAAYQRADREKGQPRNASSRLWLDFERHISFLKAEGFVDAENHLSEDGVWASQLRLDHPLLIAECLRRDAFPQDSEALLAAVIAPFVYDRGAEISMKKNELPRRLTHAYNRIIETATPMAMRMDALGFPINPLPLWTAAVIYDWARGRDWDWIIGKTGIADGDMAMLVSRTADNLKQLASLRNTHPEIAALAGKAREAILREPVIF
jgi:ATP-dependent RNA helicase HelY